MAAIYRILNVVTDSIYLGSARNPKKRRWEHWNDLKKGVHHCAALQEAWNEYGPDAFEFEILEDGVAEGRLLQVEDMYLVQHAGNAYCYNTALSSMQPPSVQPATIEKIRATSLRNWRENPESHPRLGKVHTEETKARISASKRANPTTYWEGKTRDDATRKKIGDTQRGVKKRSRVFTPEGLERARENMRRNAVIQPQKALFEVLAKFPEEVRNRYDFTNAMYTGALNRITGVVCPDHGGFSQYAAQFRKGRGCPACGAVQRAEKKREQMKQAWQTEEGRRQFMEMRRKTPKAP